MIKTIKSLPLKAFVKAQTLSLQSVESGKSMVLSRTDSRSRREMLAGAGLAAVGYGAMFSTGAVAATSGSGNSKAVNKGSSGLIDMIVNFSMLLGILVGVVSILMGLAAAIMFVTSGGQEKVVRRAKDTIKNVVIGLILCGGIFVLRGAIMGLTDSADKAAGGNGGALQNNITQNDSSFK